MRPPSGPNLGASTGGDPFSSGGDPFSSGGDPFAAAPAPNYAAQSPEGFAQTDPFAQSGSSGLQGFGAGAVPFAGGRPATIGPNALGPMPVAQRPQTIGPNNPGYPMPNAGPAPMAHMPNAAQGNAWGAQRVEPEIEESRTHIGMALGGPARPKFLITQLDGSEEGEFPLNEGENLVGREVGGIFAKDNLLSGRHATIIVQGSSVWVRDEGSRNGVYARIPRQQHVELNDGDQFCIGRIILRFEFAPAVDSVGVLHLVVGRDVDKNMFPCRIPRTGITLGRNRADLRFPLDGWVSGLHCQIIPQGPKVMLVDLGSSNGTYQRIRGVRPLTNHDALLMGQRIFHLSAG